MGYAARMANLIGTDHSGYRRLLRLFEQSVGIKGASISCALLMFGGASHCFIKGWLLNSTPTAGLAAAWGAVTLLPWLVTWEANKFILRNLAQPRLRAHAIVLVLLTSLALTGLGEWLLFMPANLEWPAILGLHTLHDLPEIGFVGLLTAISACVTTYSPTADTVKCEALGYDTQIIWARSAGNYVEFKIGQSVRVERMTLRQVEISLDPSRFARINRFTVVNRSQIVGSPRGSWIRMSDNSEYRIGHAYRESLR